MDAMIDESFGEKTSERIFTQRVAVELFFSAPHDSVVGYRLRPDGSVAYVEDPGRGADPQAREIAAEIDRGARDFVALAEPFFRALPVPPGPAALLAPLIKLATDPEPEEVEAIGNHWNFDAWGSSAGFRSYLAVLGEETALVRGDAWPAGLAALRRAREMAALTPGNGPKPGRG
jgi:hypothetical protein